MKLKDTSQNRILSVQQHLKSSGLDALLVERPLDLFYLTNLKFSSGKLLVSPKECVLLVDGRYLQIAKEKSPYPCFLDSRDQVHSFCEKHAVKKLGFDSRHTSYEHFLHLEKLFGGTSLEPQAEFFKSIRAVKDLNEISKMKKSAALLWEGLQFIKGALKVGVTEKELSRNFQIFCLEKGAEGLSFEPIIAFGANSAMPHYRSGDAILKEGDIVLIDIGIVVNGYHSDMTRCLFFKKEDPYLSKLYEIAKRSQKSALELCRPGVSVKELDLAARRVMKEENVEELFVHSLGHGIGLETHEFPRIKFDGEDKNVILEPGMVITIEPGLYVPGVGGVRFEDTIVITPNGHDNFYPNTSA